MTLSELRTLVRNYLDEPEEAFYKNTTINTLLNDSYRSLYNLLGRFNSNFTMQEDTGTITNGVNYIALPTDFLSVISFGYKDVGASASSDYIYMTFWNKQTKGVYQNSNGSPEYYWVDMKNKRLIIYPTPDDDYNYSLLYKTKIISTDLMTNDTDEPSEIPEEYQLWLVYNTVLRLLPMDRDKTIIETLIMLKQDLEIRMAEELTNLQQTTSQFLRGWR